MARNSKVIFNGIDPDNGEYLIPPMTYAQLAKLILHPHINPEDAAAAKSRSEAAEPGLGGRFGEDLDELEFGGWGIVFHADEDPKVRKAFEPLIRRRSEQVKNDKRVKVLTYSGEPTADDWLRDLEVSPGDVEPWKTPRYLLVVGSPERIPFSFGRDLPEIYAVGLLHFDQVAGYERYVNSLIDYESGKTQPRRKEAAFFRTSYDSATKLSAANLIAPLVDGTPAGSNGAPAERPVAEQGNFALRRIFDDDATCAALQSTVLCPANTKPPAFLFSASHGAGYRVPTLDQEEKTGALKCQDGTLFSAETVAETGEAYVHGLMVFLNACYSAGTPPLDEQPLRLDRAPAAIADRAFIASLPKSLLSHSSGGALGCIGHVEQALSSSFYSTEREHLIPYRNAILKILAGLPIGLALQDMRARYSARNNELVQLLYKVQAYGKKVNDKELVQKWCERNEAGGYVLIGDPAARLNVNALQM